MKNNPNSMINKFADIHAELVKLNKRVANMEVTVSSCDEGLKDEIQVRQQSEKKNFQQTELINGKMFSLRKALEDISNSVIEQFDSFKFKSDEGQKKNNESLLKSMEERLNKIDLIEKRTKELSIEATKNAEVFDSKINKGVESLTEEVKSLKFELEKQNLTVSVLEKRVGDFYNVLADDVKEIMKQLTVMKNEVDLLKSYKESSITNFKDITSEFISM